MKRTVLILTLILSSAAALLPQESLGQESATLFQYTTAGMRKLVDSKICGKRFKKGAEYNACMKEASDNFSGVERSFCGRSWSGPGFHAVNKGVALVSCDAVGEQNDTKKEYNSTEMKRFPAISTPPRDTFAFSRGNYDLQMALLREKNAKIIASNPLQLTSDETTNFYGACQTTGSPFSSYASEMEEINKPLADTSSSSTDATDALETTAAGLEVLSAILGGVSSIQQSRAATVQSRKTATYNRRVAFMNKMGSVRAASVQARPAPTRSGITKKSPVYRDWSAKNGPDKKSEVAARLCPRGRMYREEGCKLQYKYKNASADVDRCNCAGKPQFTALFNRARSIDSNLSKVKSDFFSVHCNQCESCRKMNLPVGDFCDLGGGHRVQFFDSQLK